MNTPPAPDAAGLRVGFVPGVILRKWRTVWAERFPHVPLTVVEVPQSRQRVALDGGEVDLCFTRLPLDAGGLHVIRLYDEVPVVWVSKDHPLSVFDEIDPADLAAEVVHTEVGPDALAQVVLGDAVLVVPLSVARSASRRDLVHRPLRDSPLTTVALAWRRDADHPLVDEFIGVVRGRTANSSRTAREREAGAPASAAGIEPPRRSGPVPSGPRRAHRPRGRAGRRGR